jgi:hypothetical protein
MRLYITVGALGARHPLCSGLKKLYSIGSSNQIVKDELAVLQRGTVVELPTKPRITYSFCCAFVLSFTL